MRNVREIYVDAHVVQTTSSCSVKSKKEITRAREEGSRFSRRRERTRAHFKDALAFFIRARRGATMSVVSLTHNILTSSFFSLSLSWDKKRDAESRKSSHMTRSVRPLIASCSAYKIVDLFFYYG